MPKETISCCLCNYLAKSELDLENHIDSLHSDIFDLASTEDQDPSRNDLRENGKKTFFDNEILVIEEEKNSTKPTDIQPNCHPIETAAENTSSKKGKPQKTTKAVTKPRRSKTPKEIEKAGLEPIKELQQRAEQKTASTPDSETKKRSRGRRADAKNVTQKPEVLSYSSPIMKPEKKVTTASATKGRRSKAQDSFANTSVESQNLSLVFSSETVETPKTAPKRRGRKPKNSISPTTTPVGLSNQEPQDFDQVNLTTQPLKRQSPTLENQEEEESLASKKFKTDQNVEEIQQPQAYYNVDLESGVKSEPVFVQGMEVQTYNNDVTELYLKNEQLEMRCQAAERFVQAYYDLQKQSELDKAKIQELEHEIIEKSQTAEEEQKATLLKLRNTESELANANLRYTTDLADLDFARERFQELVNKIKSQQATMNQLKLAEERAELKAKSLENDLKDVSDALNCFTQNSDNYLAIEKTVKKVLEEDSSFCAAQTKINFEEIDGQDVSNLVSYILLDYIQLKKSNILQIQDASHERSSASLIALKKALQAQKEFTKKNEAEISQLKKELSDSKQLLAKKESETKDLLKRDPTKTEKVLYLKLKQLETIKSNQSAEIADLKQKIHDLQNVGRRSNQSDNLKAQLKKKEEEYSVFVEKSSRKFKSLKEQMNKALEGKDKTISKLKLDLEKKMNTLRSLQKP